jgi:phosphoribulokinase
VNYICPQFSRTHVNFQRVPTVDTSNPFIARDIPSADESFVVIRFARPKGIDFPYLALGGPYGIDKPAQATDLPTASMPGTC